MAFKFRPLLALPPLLFAAFAGVAYVGLRRENATELPSALIGKEAPSLAGTVPLRDDPAPTNAELTAPGVKLVNFWASWCGPCRAEHPILREISASGLPVIGVNYKDQPSNALGFLAELGDPFTQIGADPSGRVALDWGIYGVPETFVVDGSGRILLRYPGPLTKAIFDDEIKPLLKP
jgi:cytochrome c biogenesis protein CcmG/thiol:disulfide interchange protein DsbE